MFGDFGIVSPYPNHDSMARLQRGRYNLPNQKLTEARKMLVSWDDENISLQFILLVRFYVGNEWE